jgi:transposase
MESMGKKPRRRRSFTPDFKAEIVELCQPGDRSVGQVARDPENIRQVARLLVTFPWAPHCSGGPAIRAVIGPSSR